MLRRIAMKNNTKVHMLIISLDALKATDIDIMKTLPNFSLLIESGAHGQRVKTIYPSLTYPAHTTIVTGNYPKNHGIVNNKLLKPTTKINPWYWFRKYIKAPTLYDICKKNKLKVGSIFWPVTANSSIKYNMPEIFSYKKYVTQEMSSLLGGSFFYQLKLFKKYSSIKNGIREPELDDFAISCAIDTLKEYNPNILMLHLLDLDTQRHGYGTHSLEAIEALKRHDERLGKIINTLKEIDIYKKTNIVVLGDHGFQDFDKVININGIFKKEGLITTDETGSIVDWDAFLKSCDGSAYIYLKNKSNANLKTRVNKILENLSLNPSNGIKTIYSNEELTALGGDYNATFMLEGDAGFVFSEKVNDSLVISAITSMKKALGTHGYSPENPNLNTFFLGSGPSFKNNITIENMNLIDIAPTLAKALNIDFPPCDGKILKELLK